MDSLQKFTLKKKGNKYEISYRRSRKRFRPITL